MALVAYAGREEEVPTWKPTTRHERKWFNIIEPASRAQHAMENLNRQGLDTFRKRGMPEAVREIVKQVATSRRVSIMLMASQSRMRVAAEARYEVMYRIRARSPGTSSPQIARWFERDHTCVLYGIAYHAEKHGLPKLVGFDLAAHRERMRATS